MKNRQVATQVAALLASATLLTSGALAQTQDQQRAGSAQGSSTQSSDSEMKQRSASDAQSTVADDSSATSSATQPSGAMDAQQPSGSMGATDSGSASAQQSDTKPVAPGESRRTAEASGKTSGTTSSAGQAGQSAAVPVVMLFVPVQMQQQSDTKLANGCWAKLYGQQKLQGDSLTLVGPVDMRDMTGPFGIEWGEKLRSIQAGPRATVNIYDNENFRDRTATVQPGKQVSDISSKMGLFDEVNSIRISCNAAGG